MKIKMCGPIKIKQNKRHAKVKICRPILFTSDCTSSYQTQVDENFITENGECLIIE